MACKYKYNDKWFTESELIYLIGEKKNLLDISNRQAIERLNSLQELFKQYPELQSIGTIFDYDSYLDTIFPDSKVKDIVYHGTVYNILNKKFDIGRAGNSTLGFANAAFFTNNKKWAWERFAFNDRMLDGTEEGNFLFYALLNIKNPTLHDTVFDFNKSIEEGFIENLHQDLEGEVISIVPLSRFSSNGNATTKQNQALINYNRDTYNYHINYISGTKKETKIVNLFGKEIKQEIPKKISKEEFEASLTIEGKEIYTNSINKINSYFNSKKGDITKAKELEKSTVRTPGVNKGSDSVISKQTDDTTLEYAVFEPEQIHVLGSKQDIKGFEEFVGKKEESKSDDLLFSKEEKINKEAILSQFSNKRNKDEDLSEREYYEDMLGPLIDKVNAGEKIVPDDFPPDAFHTFKTFVNILSIKLETKLKENDKPTILFHGSPRIFGEFKEEFLGSYTQAESAKKAFFAARDVDTALRYTEVDQTALSELGVLEGDNPEPDVEYEEYKHMMSLPEDNKERMEYEEKIELARKAAEEGKDKSFRISWEDRQRDERVIFNNNTNLYPLFFISKNPLILEVKGDRKNIESINKSLILAKEQGYDAVVFKDIYDGSKNSTDVYTVFSSTQIVNVFDIINKQFGLTKQTIQKNNNFESRNNKEESKSDDLLFSKEAKEEEVNYQFKSVNILLSDKAKQVFDKGNKNNWTLDKILTELAIPKEQKQLLLDLGIKDREQLALELLNKYSYIVEINTSKIHPHKKGEEVRDPETGDVYEGIEGKIYGELDAPTQYYSNLTVPGGTNYTENEISTPLITPSIKGHAQFATDKGIGWFRSDEKEGKVADKGKFNSETGEWDAYFLGSKTRRILEIQSDLFQKGRNREDLVRDRGGLKEKFITEEEFNTAIKGSDYTEIPFTGIDIPTENASYLADFNTKKSENKIWGYYNNGKFYIDGYSEHGKYYKEIIPTSNKNQFLQLLNKDNNWVTFFIKSIIQDSAKKGYEKVLFPKGETAAKIEGHETIADEIRKIDTKIKDLKNRFKIDFGVIENGKDEGMWYGYDKPYKNKQFAERSWTYAIEQLEQEKANLKSQGIEKLKPIEAFYEIKVGNILEKQFGKDNVKTITDEYGNQWREIEIVPERDLSDILFSKVAKEESEKILKYQVTLNDLISKIKHQVTVYREKGVTNTHQYIEDIYKLSDAYIKTTTEQQPIVLKTYISGILKKLNTRFNSYNFDNFGVGEEFIKNINSFAMFAREAFSLTEAFKGLEKLQIPKETVNMIEYERVKKIPVQNRTEAEQQYFIDSTHAINLRENLKSLEIELLNVMQLRNKMSNEFLDLVLQRLGMEVTNPEIKENLKEMIAPTLDATFVAAGMDALQDSRNPILANFGKMIETQTRKAEFEANEMEREFEKLNTEFKKRNADYSKFFDSKGRMQQEYRDEYKTELKVLKDNVRAYEITHKTHTKEYKLAKQRLRDFLEKVQRLKYLPAYYEAKKMLSDEAKVAREEIYDKISAIEEQYINRTTGEVDYVEMFKPENATDKESWDGYKKELKNLASEWDGAEQKTGEALKIAKEIRAYNKVMYNPETGIMKKVVRRKEFEEAKRRMEILYGTDKESFNTWLGLNTQQEYSKDFWSEFEEIMKELSQGKTEEKKILSEALNQILKQYKTPQGDINTPIPGAVVKKIKEIQEAMLYKDKQGNIISLKDVNMNEHVADLIRRLHELCSFVVVEEYYEAKAQQESLLKKGVITKEQFSEWYQDNHIYDQYTGEIVPTRVWTKIVPKDSKQILKEEPNDKWTTFEVRPEYLNTKANNPDGDYYFDGNKAMEDEQGRPLPKSQYKNAEYTRLMKEEPLFKFLVGVFAKMSKGVLHSGVKSGYPPLFDKNSKSLKELLFNVKPKKEKSGNTDEEIAMATDLNNDVIYTFPFQGIRKVGNQKELLPIPDGATLEEVLKIQAKNREIIKQNEIANKEAMNTNLAETFAPFIKIANKYQHYREIEGTAHMIVEVFKQNARIIRKKGGKTVVGKTDFEGNKGEPSTKSVVGSRLEEQMTDYMQYKFYGEERLDEGRLTTVLGGVQNFTSVKGMGFNVFAGLNNIVYGTIQMRIEAAAGEFIHNSALNWANGQFFKEQINLAYGSNKKTSVSVIEGVIKYMDVLQSTEELSGKEGGITATAYHKLAMVKNAAYWMMHVGEYSMQNRMLLAMMKEYRVVNGDIMSQGDFIDKKKRELKDKKNYNAKATLDEFKSYTPLIDCFELKDGFAKLKDGVVLNMDQLERFKSKVIYVNQYMHGIYDKDHTGIWNKYAIFRLALQFRKWMRPGWNRRFGARFGKMDYNERKEGYVEGMYVSTVKFLYRVARDYTKMQRSARMQWNELNAHQQANVKRTAMEMGLLSGVLLLGAMLRGAAGDDDELQDSRALNFLMMQQDRLAMELGIYTPWGLMRESKQLMASPAPATGAFEDITKVLYNSIAYPFRTEEEREYQTGAYHGQDKLEVSIKKTLPLINIIHRWNNLINTNRYYSLWNP